MTAWTDHCKEFSKKHGLSYKEAMSHPECKAEYNNMKEGGKIKWKKVGKKLGKVGMDTINFQNKVAQKVGKKLPLSKMGTVGDLIETGLDAQNRGVKLANSMYDRRKDGLRSQLKGAAKDMAKEGLKYGKNKLKQGALDYLNENEGYEGAGLHRGMAEQVMHRNHVVKPVAIKKKTPSLYEPKIRGLGVVSNRDQDTGTIESRIANIVKLRRDQKISGSGFRTVSGYGFKT